MKILGNGVLGIGGVFAKFTEKHLCQRLSFSKVAGEACNFTKRESLAQVFSRELTSVTFLKTNKRGGRGGDGGDAY